jgi:hypothetical protein
VLRVQPSPGCSDPSALLVGGIARNVIRSVSAIWVNWRVTSDERATVQSCRGQAESTGETLGGPALGVLARASTIPVAR